MRVLQGLAVGSYSNRRPFISQLLLIQKSVTQHLVCEETAHKYLGLRDEILFGSPCSSAVCPPRPERDAVIYGVSPDQPPSA